MLGIVLAGGEGKRLLPLTADRAKPAVPFGGNYRLIDFVLSNLVNAGYLRICVLTQYKSHSLDRHITHDLADVDRARQLRHPGAGAAAARPALVHRAAPTRSSSPSTWSTTTTRTTSSSSAPTTSTGWTRRRWSTGHIESGAGVTVAGIRVPRKRGHRVRRDRDRAERPARSAQFLEKPADPPGVPDDPDVSFASMGNYVFTTEALLEALRADAADEDSVHDMGGNIIPMLVDRGARHVYDFADNEVPGATDRDRGYWRDVGTLDAYYDAHMDLVSVHPIFNLYNRQWPILTLTAAAAAGEVRRGRIGAGVDGRRRHDHLRRHRRRTRSSATRAGRGAARTSQGSVVMAGVRIGRGAVVRNAILDKNVVVPEGSASASTWSGTATATR